MPNESSHRANLNRRERAYHEIEAGPEFLDGGRRIDPRRIQRSADCKGGDSNCLLDLAFLDDVAKESHKYISCDRILVVFRLFEDSPLDTNLTETRLVMLRLHAKPGCTILRIAV